jgi:uncharacterized membrane protein required for colicin V production
MILDGLVIVFIAFSAFSGYKKGLTTILISLIGFVVAIILAFMFKASLANFVIEKSDIEITMKQVIKEGIASAIQTNKSDLPDKNDSFYEGIVKNMGVGETADNLSTNVVKFILESAAFILIFLTINTCAFILQSMLNLVFDLPILSSINSIGGFGIGIIMALFKIWIFLAIVSMAVPMFGQLKAIIDSSTITKMLYETNVIVKLLSAGLKF